jgi:membrane-bound serine protease (ClpP class)
MLGWLMPVALGFSLLAAAEESRVEGQPGSALVMQVAIDGPIGPATSDYVVRSLNRAAERQAALVILRIDTPGGLDIAMRDIIKHILASPVPVAGYVAPGGARAASAGTYILYASHFAAMAPATHLGAATPVQIGFPGIPNEDREPSQEQPKNQRTSGQSAMERKMVNDAVAYIRGLAKLRGRNAEWAETAVRQAASIPAEQALALKVIDILAANTDELLKKLDGRTVDLLGLPTLLSLAGARTESLEPDWRSRLLSVIASPNVAYILLLIGIYGLIMELYHPGAVAPGTIGGICLLLALYAFQALPVNYAGFGLILFGVVLMIAEAFAPSFGILGIGGASAFAIGSVMLLDADVPGMAVHPALIAAFTLGSAGFFIILTGMVIRARRRPVVSGREALIGSRGTVIADFQGNGRVRVCGEVWLARSALALRAGQPIVVQNIDGLTLVVTPTDEGDPP